MTSIRLSEDVEAQLTQLCTLTKRSKSFYVKEALERYLEDIADYYIVLDRIAKPGRLLSTEELLQELETGK